MEQDLKQARGSIPKPEEHLEFYEIAQLNYVRNRIVEAMCNNHTEAKLHLICELLPSVQEHLLSLGYQLQHKQNRTTIYWKGTK
jgi:hypothetical protein